jgi:hypothetical protein
VGVLPEHGTAGPTLCLSGREARREGGGVDVSIIGVTCGCGGLADDNLVERDTLDVGELEDGGVRPLGGGGGEEVLAGRVFGNALVVELDVVLRVDQYQVVK